ncbi:MAG: hypothetical protein ACEQSA_06215 [Weeksellaceae bacterium]
MTTTLLLIILNGILMICGSILFAIAVSNNDDKMQKVSVALNASTGFIMLVLTQSSVVAYWAGIFTAATLYTFGIIAKKERQNAENRAALEEARQDLQRFRNRFGDGGFTEKGGER